MALVTSQIPASYAVTPTVLASGQSYPNAIVQNGRFVYWADFGNKTINRVDISGGPTKVLANFSGYVGALQVSGGFIYWTDFLGLHKLATSGGSVQTIDPCCAMQGAVVSGRTIYFIGEDNVYEISTNGTDLKEIVSGQSLGSLVTLIKEGNYVVTWNFENGSIAFISLVTHRVVSQPYEGHANCSSIIESGIINMVYAAGFVYFTETGVCSKHDIGILGKVSITQDEKNLYVVKGPTLSQLALLNGIALKPGASQASSMIVFGQTAPSGNGTYSFPLTGSTGRPKLLFSLATEGIAVSSGVIYATGSSEVVSYA